MIVTLICLSIGLLSALATYFFTPLFAHWYFAFLILPMWLGYALAALAIYTLTLIIICYTVPLKKEVKKPHWAVYHMVCQLIQFVFLFFRVTPHLTGVEMIPEDKPFLLASNHLSMFDFLIVMARLDRFNIVPIAKKESENFPIAGRVSHYMGFVPLDRSNAVAGLRGIIQAINVIRYGGGSIYVAPEGTRSKDGKLGEFHPGSFKIAEKAKAPVVVCCIYGTPEINKNYIRHRTHVYLDVLKVWSSEEVAKMTTVEMAEASQHMIQEAYDRYLEKEKTHA